MKNILFYTLFRTLPKYSEIVVRLSTMLCTRVNCGLRQVVEILNVINDTFEGFLGTIPSYNTIDKLLKNA